MGARHGKPAPTMSDVARLAGVNRVTASVALNNRRANTRVSEETRQRVLAAAAELRYQPNHMARSLRRGSTRTFGFYCGGNFNNAATPFFSHLISGLQRGCEEHGLDLLLHQKHGQPPEQVYAELANGKVDGLVCFVSENDPAARLLAESHLPVVAIVDLVSYLPSVAADDAAGARMQVEHLWRKGHRRVYFQTVAAEPTSIRRRRMAFLQAAAEWGLEVIVDAGGTLATGLSDAGRELLAASAAKRPTAAVGWADQCAYQILAEVLRLGLRVPEDLAVVGFDGFTHHVEPVWRMTTVAAPWIQVATHAVKLLVKQWEGGDIQRETLLPVELVVGNTT